MTKVPGSPEWDVPDDHFRRLFGIPAAHELRRVSYQVVNIDTQEWQHEELSAGVLVAAIRVRTGSAAAEEPVPISRNTRQTAPTSPTSPAPSYTISSIGSPRLECAVEGRDARVETREHAASVVPYGVAMLADALSQPPDFRDQFLASLALEVVIQAGLVHLSSFLSGKRRHTT